MQPRHCSAGRCMRPNRRVPHFLGSLFLINCWVGTLVDTRAAVPKGDFVRYSHLLGRLQPESLNFGAWFSSR